MFGIETLLQHIMDTDSDIKRSMQIRLKNLLAVTSK